MDTSTFMQKKDRRVAADTSLGFILRMNARKMEIRYMEILMVRLMLRFIWSWRRRSRRDLGWRLLLRAADMLGFRRKLFVKLWLWESELATDTKDV